MRGRLENEGIECFVEDENALSWQPHLAMAVNGFKLQVATADEQKAVALLKEAGYLGLSNITDPPLQTIARYSEFTKVVIVIVVILLLFATLMIR